MGSSVVLALALALASCALSGHARLSEVLYDAEGADTGYEFVELWNPSALPVPLAGLRIEAGDGSGAGRWTLRWTGGAGDTIGAGARFVIGGSLVDPPPDAVATLDLQNGPDAVRLVWPDGATEVLGYGALAYPEYFCGEPAGDVVSGQSLARVPDDADLGSNALDFRAAPPSPGRANQVTLDVALRRGSLALEPEQPAAFAGARLTGVAVNLGSASLPAGAILLSCTSAAGTLAESTLTVAPAPAESARFVLELPGLPPGRAALIARLILAGDERGANDADTLHVRIGPGPLEITEIQFHPRGGEGEWVEVRSRLGVTLDLADFTLADRGTGRGVAGAAAPLPPESLAVLAQDRAALLARFPDLDPARVVAIAPWAALNNSDDSTGFADAVVLRERDGTRCDRVDYRAHGIPDGVPIERYPYGWAASGDAAGTPLKPPLEPAPIAGRIEIAPRRLRAGSGPLRVAWALPWARAHVTVDAYDLAGRRVARLAAESLVPGRAERALPITALPPGVYRVVLRAQAEAGNETLIEARAVRVDGSVR